MSGYYQGPPPQSPPAATSPLPGYYQGPPPQSPPTNDQPPPGFFQDSPGQHGAPPQGQYFQGGQPPYGAPPQGFHPLYGAPPPGGPYPYGAPPQGYPHPYRYGFPGQGYQQQLPQQGAMTQDGTVLPNLGALKLDEENIERSAMPGAVKKLKKKEELEEDTSDDDSGSDDTPKKVKKTTKVKKSSKSADGEHKTKKSSKSTDDGDHPKKSHKSSKTKLDHPFAALADKKQENISLTIFHEGELTYLKPTINVEESEAAFTMKGDEASGTVYRGPLMMTSENEAKLVGKWETHEMAWHDDITFKFPESGVRSGKKLCEWGFDVSKEGQKGAWCSDVGFRPGHDFVWYLTDKRSPNKIEQRFRMWCEDLADQKVLCDIHMSSFYEGVITFPLDLFKDRDQLEEMMVVGWAAMHRQRQIWADEIKDEIDSGEYRKNAARRR